jgi:transcriptional regulator
MVAPEEATMYNPPHFREERPEILHRAIAEIAFATLVTEGPDGIIADHLPFLLDAERGVLRGHVARANPVWKEARADREALVIFLGPDAYVTPSWYATKAATGKVVPTWNYLTVHVRGMLEFFDDATRLRTLVTDLTQRHEAERAQPWAVSDAPAGYIDTMLRAIVGVELSISAIEGKWKLSQNRDAADREGVRAGLAARNPAIVRHMP